jgi:AAA domain
VTARDELHRLQMMSGHDFAPADYEEIRLGDVTPEPIHWLWPGRLPFGKLVVLDGDPGVAKSTLMIDVAARVSTGAAMPDDDWIGEPRTVVLMSAEDSAADTIRPRLDAAGADADQVFALTHVTDIDDNGIRRRRPPLLPDDIDRLERMVAAHGAALVVVDVLMAYLSSNVNSYRDQDVRRALVPLQEMAERRACCVVVLRHLRKAAVGSAIYAGGGSIGIIGAARLAMVAAFDPDDAQLDRNDRRRVLAIAKCNIAREAPSLSYRVVDANGTGRIEWLGRVAHNADALVSSDANDNERTDKELFLASLLRDGPVPAKEIERAARSEGWTLKQLRPVLRRLGGQISREGFGPGGRWLWTLFEDARRSSIGNEDAHSQNGETTGPIGHQQSAQDELF